MRDIALLAKTYCVQICLSKKLHKQTCPSTKRCQMCSGFDQTTLHDPAKQIKQPTANFSTENGQKHWTLASEHENCFYKQPSEILQSAEKSLRLSSFKKLNG